MSELVNTLLSNIKECMKAKESEKLETLRTLHSEVKNVGINAKRDLCDDDVIEVVSRNIKQKRDAIELFTKGGRKDLVEAEERKINWLQEYLPEALDSEALQALVLDAVKESGATQASDMGKVMKILMPKVKGKADNREVSKLVREALS